MISFERDHYFTDQPQFAVTWGGVMAFVAVAACYVWDVQTAFVSGGGKWHHAARGPDLPQMGDTGVRLELGPHAWWKRLGPHEVELVLKHWRALGVFHVERSIANPEALIAMTPIGRVM